MRAGQKGLLRFVGACALLIGLVAAFGGAMWLIMQGAPPQAVRLKDDTAVPDRSPRSRGAAAIPDFSRLQAASVPWTNTLRLPHAAAVTPADLPWERDPATPASATLAVAQSPWVHPVFAAEVPLAQSPWARADLNTAGLPLAESPWARLDPSSADAPLASLPWQPAPTRRAMFLDIASVPDRFPLPQSPRRPLKVHVQLATLTPDDDQREKDLAAKAPKEPFELKLPRFIMALAQDQQGNLWVGAEDDYSEPWDKGVWRYEPAADRWTQFTVKDGLGDDNGYALAVDRKNRVWVGHLNHGVSVFNGDPADGKGRWQNYEVVAGLSRPDTLAGPLGERVVDIAVCPTDGDVWIASDLGLARYSESKDDWTYYTRADGLPSDQVQAMAFDADGNLYAGTQCDGLAIAQAADQYKTWRQVTGPDEMPTVPYGEGLPTNLINDVLVTKDGTLYVATTLGLAESKDRGQTFRYWRGQDWADKVRGRYGGPPQGWKQTPGALLAEDYVTCLAESREGTVSVGYRQKGYEVLNRDLRPHRAGTPGVYVMALLDWRCTIATGIYDRVAGQFLAPSLRQLPEPRAVALPVKIPSGASAPMLARLEGQGERPPPQLADGVQEVGSNGAVSHSAVFLGQDWSTRGDWIGRYGRQKGVLCGANSPFNHNVAFGKAYKVKGQLGPHHRKGDQLRHWVHWARTDQQRSLWNPCVGYRRQSEWDDHGETYPFSFEGPDIWVKVSLPAGRHRVSMYFVNKDGHSGNNRYRDYSLEVRHWNEAEVAGKDEPVLARARVRDFWGGVHKSFVLTGGTTYLIGIGREYSFNTIVSSVTIDRLTGQDVGLDAELASMALPWMGNVRYEPSSPPTHLSVNEYIKSLWSRSASVSPFTERWRIDAFRSVTREAMSPRDPSLHSWRWQLALWTGEDRLEFRKTVAAAWEGMKALNPGLASR